MHSKNAKLTTEQGFSYTLTTLTLPTILTLPSASSAARAFTTLREKATANLRALTAISSTTFLLAFLLSPRAVRHPYLLYTSVLVATSGLADKIAPHIFAASEPPASAPVATPAARRQQHIQQQQQQARRRAMEASYEVLGDVHSEGTGSASGEEVDEEHLNGEEVRGDVEAYLKTTVVQTAVASVGFLMAIIGIWGDGVPALYASETIVYV